MPSTDLAISFFGDKSRVSIDRKFPLIRIWKKHAAASDGARLRERFLDKTDTANQQAGETQPIAQKANKDFMEQRKFVSKVDRQKPHLKPMPRHVQRPNAGKSVVRSCVEHVFADHKVTNRNFHPNSGYYS